MDVNSVIDNLCERFGTTAAYLIPEIARYKICQSMVLIIFGMVPLIAAIWIFRKGMSDYKSAQYKYDNDQLYHQAHCRPTYDDYFGYWITAGILFPIGFIIIMFSTYAMIGWISSPTAAFTEFVLNGIKGGS